MFIIFVYVFLFFKQKTAYEMRISDWSSDVCSSDLPIILHEVSQPSLAASLKCRLHGILIPSSEVFNIPTILDILHKKIRERVKVTSPDIRASLKAKGCLSRSEEHTSELQSLMRTSYAVFCLKKKKKHTYELKEANT